MAPGFSEKVKDRRKCDVILLPHKGKKEISCQRSAFSGRGHAKVLPRQKSSF